LAYNNQNGAYCLQKKDLPKLELSNGVKSIDMIKALGLHLAFNLSWEANVSKNSCKNILHNQQGEIPQTVDRSRKDHLITVLWYRLLWSCCLGNFAIGLNLIEKYV